MKILFHHPEYILNNNNNNTSFLLQNYNNININNINLSELQYNDNFKYIKVFYNNLKFIIKTPIINNYIIEKYDIYYILKFDVSYINFFTNLEKYIIKKSIKQLNNWFSNNKFYYSSIINNDTAQFEIKVYNDILFSNNLTIDSLYSNYLNNIFYDLSLEFQIYGLWISNNDINYNNDNDNNMFIGLYIKSLFIDI